jgi:hypothetical protein
VKGSDSDSEVNPRGPLGEACRLGRTHCRQSSMAVKVFAERGRSAPGIPRLRTRRRLC